MKKQNIFTPESLKHPALKGVINGLDKEFIATEGKQEAGKFGIKPKGEDDK